MICEHNYVHSFRVELTGERRKSFILPFFWTTSSDFQNEAFCLWTRFWISERWSLGVIEKLFGEAAVHVFAGRMLDARIPLSAFI